jgi:hypothetical protein
MKAAMDKLKQELHGNGQASALGNPVRSFVRRKRSNAGQAGCRSRWATVTTRALKEAWCYATRLRAASDGD